MIYVSIFNNFTAYYDIRYAYKKQELYFKTTYAQLIFFKAVIRSIFYDAHLALCKWRLKLIDSWKCIVLQ